MPKQGRRAFIKGTAAATAALAFPYIRTSHAAGSLSVGFWDHWVPGANDVLTKICQNWAKQEKIDLKIASITSQGNKIVLTATAEAHAALAFPYIRPSHAAGSLSVGFWDHWVPGAND